MVQIEWTEIALMDLKEIQFYIQRNSKFYAQKTVENLVLRTQILKKFPLSGRIVPERNDEDFRELIEGNYRIMYKVVSVNKIDILSIYHSARNFI